jgi:tetratricopeptide (TPR) repeat protein
VRNHRLLLKLAGLIVIVAAVAPHPAEAQRNRQQNLRQILIPPPLTENATDSAYAVVFAQELRDRLAGKVRNQMGVVPSERYCEALDASGFPCHTILDEMATEQLARFVSADAYIVGHLSGAQSSPTLALRLVDIGRSGLGGQMDLTAEPGDNGPRDFADYVADTMRAQISAAREVQECNERRDRSDFGGARDRADRAFQMYPNHPAAALCVAYLFEATQQVEDSLIWAYEKCTKGDPQNDRCWSRIASLYLAKGDSLGAIGSFRDKLNVVPTDTEHRITVARMFGEANYLDSAVAVLDEAREIVDADVFDELMQLKVALCLNEERYDCALEAYETRYELNPALIQDTTFVKGAIGAAGFAEDREASLEWTGRAVQAYPGQLSYLQQHAVQLVGAGMSDSAMAINRQIVEVDPENIQAALSIAQVLTQRIVIDSTVPRDTMLTAEIDSILTAVASRSTEERVLASVGQLYVGPALREANLQANGDSRWAAEWLSKALEQPIPEQIRNQANFFLGLSTIFFLGEAFAEAQAAETCEAVERYSQLVMRGKNALQAGQSISPQAVQSLLSTQYPAYEEVIPQLRAAYSCSR